MSTRSSLGRPAAPRRDPHRRPVSVGLAEALGLLAAVLLAGLLALTLALRANGPAEGLPLPDEPAAWACLTA